jgi:hypothetical protein
MPSKSSEVTKQSFDDISEIKRLFIEESTYQEEDLDPLLLARIGKEVKSKMQKFIKTADYKKVQGKPYKKIQSKVR